MELEEFAKTLILYQEKIKIRTLYEFIIQTLICNMTLEPLDDNLHNGTIILQF